MRGSPRTEFLSRNLQNLTHLLIPVLPVVIAGQLPVLVRNFLLMQERRVASVIVGEHVFGSAVEVKVRQRRNPRGGRVARQLVECLAGDGVAVTLQNGLGNRETLAQSLGSDRVALGTTTTGATLLGPGLARAGGEGVISIERHPALGPIEVALRDAKFNLHLVEDAQSLIWGKLVINAAINPLTALLRVPNGQLLERPSARRMMSSLAQETAQVASAEKISLPFPDPIAAAEDVARKTGTNYSSMFQDVLRGAPTEIDAICGAVVKTAQKHQIHTPANWACWNLVKALVN